MGLHCHQPVDNFGYIFEDAYRMSYEPFIGVLEKHPKIKLSIHYSGPVLEWVIKNKPDFVERIKKLVERGQTEILTGGYYEPVLSMIPREDRKAQIRMLTELIRKHFAYEPKGLWLAERVWDPGLADLFKDLNILYTIVDDFHLIKAGVGKEDLFSRYSIEGAGDFSVFASIKKLRYAVPFRKPELTIDFLKTAKAGYGQEPFVTFADDCEKFGFWPHTYDWVYKRGWLDRFFSKLEKSDCIKTMTFTEAIKRSAPQASVKIPHSSYAEMMEWCGGDFNNFFKKYPESDFMKNRMLHLSEEIKRLEKDYAHDKKTHDEAKKEMYKSQSNCGYWHGVFGGIYSRHLRQGIFSHIIKAESMLEKGDAVHIEKNSSFIRARNKSLNLIVNPEAAGSIFEIDYKPLFYNLVNTISRKYEPYHQMLIKKRKSSLGLLKKKIDKENGVDLYEVLGIRERNLRKFLHYDTYQKRSLICHVMSLKTSLRDFIESRHAHSVKDSFLGAYDSRVSEKEDKPVINLKKEGSVILGAETYPLTVNKCIVLEKSSEIFIKLELENKSEKGLKFIFGVEFNWSLEDTFFMRSRKKRKVKEIRIVDRFSRIRIDHIFEEPVDLWSFPVYALNETEKGLGKSYQELSLLFHKTLSLSKGQKFSLGLRLRISDGS